MVCPILSMNYKHCYFLREVKTCITLTKRKAIQAGYSSPYICTILQFILPFWGPLLYACLLISTGIPAPLCVAWRRSCPSAYA